MFSGSKYSEETLQVIAALAEQPSAWQDERMLATHVGMTSDRLSVLIAQLAHENLIQVRLRDERCSGEPQRPSFQLTAEGLAVAVVDLAAATAWS